MPKLTITISDEAHPILKDWAAKDLRSLTNYLMVLLDNLTGVKKFNMYLPVNITHEPELFTKPGIQITPIPENPTGQSYTPTNQI